jgi:transcriptional regulator with XRE-family HTH domain
VAQRIKIAREEQGLNQDELAQKTGIARSNIVRIEKGQHIPTYTTLLKVANVSQILI